MPFLVGAQDPVVTLDALGGQAVRPPHLEPPVLAPFVVDLAHRAAEIERLVERLLDQRGTAGRLHHRRRHVARRDDRVLRRRRRVHEVGLVEDRQVELPRFRVLHDDLRRLRNAREQLVRRMSGEDDRFLAARPVLADRVHVAIELVERRVRQPCLVEMQCLDAVSQRAFQHLDVVGDPVVRASSERQDARLLVLRLARKGIGLDALGDVLRREFLERNGSDNAQVIARRRQEYRNGAGHGDGVQYRHVAVAVDDDDVVGRHVGVPHHLVRRRRAVGDEEAMVGVEDARSIALGSRTGPV